MLSPHRNYPACAPEEFLETAWSFSVKTTLPLQGQHLRLGAAQFPILDSVDGGAS